MDKLKEYKYIILILLMVLGFAFYWYEWRPIQIKKKCFDIAVMGTYFDKDYQACLLDNGL